MIPFLLIFKSLNDHSYTEACSDYGRRDKPASIMNEPGKIEAEFLTIVVLDEVEWLHISQEAFCNHTI